MPKTVAIDPAKDVLASAFADAQGMDWRAQTFVAPTGFRGLTNRSRLRENGGCLLRPHEA
jgi:hypothetical protein